MHLLIEMLKSPWFWVDVALSTIGGILVWYGLRIEKRAERLMPPESFKPDLFEDIIAVQKAEVERGWRILMAGIAIEVVAALGISVISGLEIAELKDRAAGAMKLAAEANERATLIESNNLALKKKLVAMLRDQEPWRVAPFTLVGPLSSVTGVTVFLLVIPDHDAAVLADDLEREFTFAGWKCVREPARRISLDGVAVSVLRLSDGKAWEASRALAKELEARGMLVSFQMFREFGVQLAEAEAPTNTLVVGVGKKVDAFTTRLTFARREAWEAQRTRAGISNAWYKVFSVEADHRKQQIDIGLWPTNFPQPAFNPGGYAADGTPLDLDGKPIPNGRRIAPMR